MTGMEFTAIGLLGSGGHADEVEAAATKKVAFRAVNAQFLAGKATVDLSAPGFLARWPVHAAVGSPHVRRLMVQAWPGERFETIIAKTAQVDPSTVIGCGSYIAAGAIITVDAELGKHVLVNVGAIIHHGCRLGDFVTVSPRAVLGGNVTVADGAFIGIGSTVRNGLSISSGAVIGAGAVLTADADVPNGVYLGVPARLAKVNEDWLRIV